MIKPKHSFGKKSFEVNEAFIDREEAKELYHNKLNHNDKDYNILVFYGVGGIGKTRLRREICRMHKEENRKAVIFYLDLNAADDRNLGSGILKLVDSCDAAVDFKCFEMAYALYFRKKYPAALYGREKGMVTENTAVGIGLNILGLFDNGITGTAAEIIEKSIRAIANRTIDKEVKEELKNFDDYSLAEMEERLPLFFQYDLQSYLKKQKDAKVLMVFDTFEALNENVIEQVHRSKNERWIQDLISYFDSETFPNLLITIFGREEIEWEEEWGQILDQYQLVEFEEQYSKEYLQKAGIDAPDIIDAIIHSSKGYPFLLYLSLETYANMKNSGRDPVTGDFEGSYPEIIERFLYNLDKDTVEVLRLLAVPNYYDVSIFRLLIREYNVSFPMSEFEQFNKYSFVSYDAKEHEFYIHDLMRKGILEKSSGDWIQSVHHVMLQYFSDKASGGMVSKYVLELFYHARKSMDVESFNRWLTVPVQTGTAVTPLQEMKKQQERGEQSILIQIINGIRSEYKLEDLLIDLVNIYIDVVHLGGDYDTAVSICETYLSQYTDEDIAKDEQLIKMRIRKIHHSMFYMPVNGLIREAEELLGKTDILKYPQQYNELLFLLGGNLGVLSGNLEFSAKWLEQSMAYAREHGFDSFVHRTIRKQADIYLAQDDFDHALRLINQTVTIDSVIEDIDSRYKIYLMGVLGEVYRKQGMLDPAWCCYDIVDKKSTENYLPGWQAHSYLAKGMLKMYAHCYTEAEEYLEQASAIYKKIRQEWGIINTMEARLLMMNMQGMEIEEDELNNCRLRAERMNYQYNAAFVDALQNEENPYLQLFFL